MINTLKTLLNFSDIDEAMNKDHSHGGQNDGVVYGAGDTDGGQNECEGGLSDGENECKEDGRVEAVVGVFGDDKENENYRDTLPCSDSEEDQQPMAYDRWKRGKSLRV